MATNGNTVNQTRQVAGQFPVLRKHRGTQKINAQKVNTVAVRHTVWHSGRDIRDPENGIMKNKKGSWVVIAIIGVIVYWCYRDHMKTTHLTDGWRQEGERVVQQQQNNDGTTVSHVYMDNNGNLYTVPVGPNGQ